MPIYGIDYFAGARFGLDPSLVRPDFSVAPFAAQARDYTTLLLRWVKPPSSSCTQLQLVRNEYNLPQDETDGLIIFTRSAADVASYLDTTVWPGFHYYSMFGWDSVNNLWIRCTDLIALVPVGYASGSWMYSRLPAAYHDRDIVLVDPYNPWPDDGTGQPPLERYLNLIGFQVDFIRTELESLMSVNDAQSLSGALLPLLAYQLGLPNEPEIGMQQARQLAANAIHLYKLKGSSRGITEFASILTSYPTALVHKGYNLLLTRDDSVMETSIGTWQAWPPLGTGFPLISGENVGLGLTAVPNLLTVPGMTNPLEIIGFEPGPPPYNNTGMAVTVTATSTSDFTTGAIPTLDFLSASDGPGNVTFTVQIWGTGSQRQVELSIWGDVGNNVPIQVAAPQTFTTTFGDWAKFQITAPMNFGQYYWIYPRVRILNQPANQTLYITLVQLWACDPEDIGVNTPVYDYPRNLMLVLQPQASNLLANTLTNFPNGLDGWSTAVGPLEANNLLTVEEASFEAGTVADWMAANLATTLTSSTAFAHDGVRSMKLTYQSSGLNEWFPILPLTLGPTTAVVYPLAATTPSGVAGIDLLTGGQTADNVSYPVGGWFLAQTTGRPCQLQITWYDVSGNKLGTNTLSGTDAVGTWTHLSGTFTAPVGTATCSLAVSITGCIDGENHYVDDLTIGGRELTGQLAIRNTGAVHGTSSMEFIVDGAGATVYAGSINQFTPPQASVVGWFVDANGNWYSGATFGPGVPQPWFDPVSGWFFASKQYFSAPSEWSGGDWFPQYSPPSTDNLIPFNTAPSEVFNFSIYAQYLLTIIPSDAVMELGFRWFFPDRSWVDTFAVVNTLTNVMTRYDVTGLAPLEAVTGTPANKFFCFCRLPVAQPGESFLFNSAMLSLGSQMPPYMDATLFPGNPDYIIDSQGASYYYRRRAPRTARLRAELYRWIPMGATYSEIFGAGEIQPPIDPTEW